MSIFLSFFFFSLFCLSVFPSPLLSLFFPPSFSFLPPAYLPVPVRAELLATLDEHGVRKRRAILRPLALGRERLEARVSRLPRPDVLAAQCAQRLDDLGEMLRRALGERATRAGNAIQLATARYAPALVSRPLGERRQRIEALERLRLSLDPKAPLRRGYVMVSDSEGRVVKTAAEAGRQPSLTLAFADGKFDVAPAGTRAATRKPRGEAAAGQAELF